MKIASLRVGNYQIEAYNNMWTGIETVHVNGHQVSRQFNWFHGIHRFSLPANDGYFKDEYRVDFRFSWSSNTMISVDIACNGVCLLSQSGRHQSKTSWSPQSLQPNYTPVGYDTLELRQLETQPLYREEDLV